MRGVQAAVLASGSAGNSLYVEADGEAVLVDCGLTVPGLKRRLAELGRDLSRVQGVFITHDHGDHVGSSVALARKQGIPLHATAGTLSILRRLPPELTHAVRGDEPVNIGPFEVLPFSVPHDGAESVAYRITHRRSGRSVAIATDLGHVTRRVVHRLEGVHFLVVEHNHDERLLRDGPYPQSLKKRIHGGYGHLSNEAGAALVRSVAHAGLRRVVLAHLSETNNTPDHARRTFERVNADAGTFAVHVAEQSRPSDLFEV